MQTRLRSVPLRLAATLVAAAFTCVLVLPGIASARPGSAQGCGALRSFSGDGGKSLGTLSFPRDSTLSWTNSGAIFQILSSEDVPVNSQAHRGTTVLESGTYKHFQVNAMGSWTISIKVR
jgi:hypothetical protein